MSDDHSLGSMSRFSGIGNSFSSALSGALNSMTTLNLGDEEVETKASIPQQPVTHRADNIHRTVKGNIHSAPSSPAPRKQIASKKQAAETQEDLQRKMKILMANPKLWAEFKQRLGQSDQKTGKLGVNQVLKEFFEENEEVKAELEAQEHEEKTQKTSRKMSFLATVNSLTSDLAGEAKDKASAESGTRRNNSMGFAPKSQQAAYGKPRRSTMDHSSGSPTTSYSGNKASSGTNSRMNNSFSSFGDDMRGGGFVTSLASPGSSGRRLTTIASRDSSPLSTDGRDVMDDDLDYDALGAPSLQASVDGRTGAAA